MFSFSFQKINHIPAPLRMSESQNNGFTWTDTYGVELAGGEDDILILAATVVVDMACHGDNR